MPERKEVHLGLLVEERRKDGYYHVDARPVLILPMDKIRNTPDGLINGLFLYDLGVYSQGSDDDHKPPNKKRNLYSWNLQYKMYRVELREARLMVKTLETLERRMQKLDAKFGRPETFGHYLGRVAAAIGADAFVWRSSNVQSKGWGYDDVVHTIAEVQAGITQVNWWIEKWVTEPEAA